MASRSWNRVELIGNLTRDPELRFTPSGTAVSTFGLATNRTYVVEGERKEEVEFHKIVAWSKLAELCTQLLKKGTRVFLSGRLQYREWETQEGQKRRDAEIVLEDMIIITPKNGAPTEEVGPEVAVSEENLPETAPEEEKGEPKEKKEAGASKPTESVSEEDLPF